MIEHARAESKQCVAECFVLCAIPALRSPAQQPDPIKVRAALGEAFFRKRAQVFRKSYTLFHWHLLPVTIIQNYCAHCIHGAESSSHWLCSSFEKYKSIHISK